MNMEIMMITQMPIIFLLLYDQQFTQYFTTRTQMTAAISLLTVICAIISWSKTLSGPRNMFLGARLRNSSQQIIKTLIQLMPTQKQM